MDIFAGLRWLGRYFLIFLAFSILGQIPVRGRNLENSYHAFVNTPEFQNYFWTMAQPVTWSGHKIKELVAKVSGKKSPANPEAPKNEAAR